MSSSLGKNPSYWAVNYLLRPAKNVERKMLCEAFQALSAVQRVQDYRYIGFGATYFTDFCLFHRDLGIEDMFSIEANREDEPRVQFNVPFNCIKVKMGKASEKLREIPLEDKPAIIWLDYDYSIDSGVLFDLNLVASKVPPFSIIVVTLDARPEKLSDPKTSDNRDIDEDIFAELSPEKKLEEKIGTGKIPPRVKRIDLRGDGLCEVYRRLSAYEIMNALGGRILEGNRLRYKQLFNFRYSDGQEMLTLGGIIFNPRDLSRMEKCNFRRLPCYRPGRKYLRITAPKLTFREIRELNRFLPTEDIASIHVPIPETDKQSYKGIYRYFPVFTEAEV